MMKLDGTMVIVGDLGELKMFDVKKSEAIIGDSIKKSYSLEVINDILYIDAHKKISEVVSDSAGNFCGSIVQEHELENERKKRTLKDIAKDIEKAVKLKKPKRVFLAFAKESLSKLLDELDQSTKDLLSKTISVNLIKTDKNKILSYFE